LINRNEETAFPVPDDQLDERQCGMSLRDWFAGKAMEAMIARGAWDLIYPIWSARDCYTKADAMMEARKEAKQ
jgi:hypothetical protein